MLLICAAAISIRSAGSLYMVPGRRVLNMRRSRSSGRKRIPGACSERCSQMAASTESVSFCFADFTATSQYEMSETWRRDAPTLRSNRPTVSGASWVVSPSRCQIQTWVSSGSGPSQVGRSAARQTFGARLPPCDAFSEFTPIQTSAGILLGFFSNLASAAIHGFNHIAMATKIWLTASASGECRVSRVHIGAAPRP